MKMWKAVAVVMVAWLVAAGCGETFTDARDDTRSGDTAADAR